MGGSCLRHGGDGKARPPLLPLSVAGRGPGQAASSSAGGGSGITQADHRISVGAYLETWLGNVRPRVRPRTYQSYEMIVRVHLVPAFSSVPLARLAPQQVQSLLNAKATSGSSPRTVAIIRAVLRLALGQAERWGMVSRNVARLVDPPRVIRREFVPSIPSRRGASSRSSAEIATRLYI